MDSNKKKKNRKILGIVVIGGIVIVGTMLYQAMKIESLKKKLYMAEGENENLKYTVSGYEKELKQLIYQTGKLSSQRRNNNE